MKKRTMAATWAKKLEQENDAFDELVNMVEMWEFAQAGEHPDVIKSMTTFKGDNKVVGEYWDEEAADSWIVFSDGSVLGLHERKVVEGQAAHDLQVKHRVTSRLLGESLESLPPIVIPIETHQALTGPQSAKAAKKRKGK